MSTTDIDICAHALVMIGAEPLTSFTDGTTESKACSNLYETTVRDQLSRYRWRFASALVQLSRLDDEPVARWDAAYQLPTDMLSLTSVYVNDKPVDFDRFEDRVFCDVDSATEVYAEGIYRIDERFWPPYFITLIEYQMASLLAHSIAAQVDTADWLDKKAVRQAAIARTLDAQARTAPRIDTTRLVTYRFRSTG